MERKSYGLRVTYAWAWLCLAASGCVFEFSEVAPREHGTVGAEVFRTVCMGLAAQAYPNDLTGQKFEARCAGTDTSTFAEIAPVGEASQRAFARYNALVKRRTSLVEALDATFDSVLFADDELRGFLSNLIPLYEGPELLPVVTRAAAEVLRNLIDQNAPASQEAIAAFERMGARGGYRPLRLALGVARPVLEYPDLDAVVSTTLETLDPETGSAKTAWQELLKAAALDLATADATPPDPLNPGTLAVARSLLLKSDATFSGNRGPLYVARRDYRGVVKPTLLAGKVPAPFVDSDGDGSADLDELGRLKVNGMGSAPTPFTTLTATLFNLDQGVRDELGRAINMGGAQDICASMPPATGCGVACGTNSPCGAGLTCGASGTCVWDGKPPLFFDYIDADKTLLAGVTRDLGKLFLAPEGAAPLTPAVMHDFAYGLSAVIGEFKPQTFDAQNAKLSFIGPDTATGPMFDLVYALGTLLPFEDTTQLLDVLNVLLAEHENEVAGLLEAGLYIDAQADKYPNAKWEQPHEFWDDLIVWTQRVLRRKDEAKQKDMLEAILRALATEESAKSGPLFGNFMRYRDRVSYPKGTLEELKAGNVEIKDVIGPMGASSPNASIAAAVQAHRTNVNFPCPPLPTDLSDPPVADCTPQAPLPAPDHKGIRNCEGPDCTSGCPAEIPAEGEPCASAGGYGLCSYPVGSCVCDCDGGLCRGQTTPKWTCGLPRTPGYAKFVNRNMPDIRVGSDGQTNQSLFQRTAALVHDLHVPAVLCNKAQARMKLYDPAGSVTESGLASNGLFISALPLLGAGGALDAKAECAVLNERQIVRFFSRAIVGNAVLEVKDPALNNLLDQLETLSNGLLGNAIGLFGINPAGLGRNEVMQRQSQLRGLYIGGENALGQVVRSPTPQAVARLVFGPSNPFQAHLLNLPVTRDETPIVDLHRDTIFAWEVPDPIAGVSYYQALKPLLEAFDENELYNTQGELADGYLFGDLISLIHKHWSSRSTDATKRACNDSMSPPVCDEKAKLFAFQSNGMSYEDLVADALIDAKLMARIRDVMVALKNIEVAPGVDGIAVLARVTTNLLDPARSCGPMGCEMQPLTARDKVTRTTKTNTGKEIARLTPAHLLFDALNNIDKSFVGEKEQRLLPWRHARSELVDLLLEVERPEANTWKLKNPRARAVMLNVIALLKDRLVTYKKQEEACLMAGGTAATCQQRRAWALGLTSRLEKSLGQPVSAATLRLLDQYWKAEGDPGGELLKLVNFVSKEQSQINPGDNDAFDSTLLSVTDMLQVFEDSPNVAPVMRFLSTAVAPNALTVAAQGGELKPEDLAKGSLEKTLELLREVKKLDTAPKGQQTVLTKLMRALATVHGKNGETPLEVILDTIAEVNRAAPGADSSKSLNGADIRAVLDETQQFLSSERHGLERLYDIIQERKLK